MTLIGRRSPVSGCVAWVTAYVAWVTAFSDESTAAATAVSAWTAAVVGSGEACPSRIRWSRSVPTRSSNIPRNLFHKMYRVFAYD